jgi:hypothetical protein
MREPMAARIGERQLYCAIMRDLSDDLDSTDRSKLSEDRLAWLAVRDYVRSRCRPSFLLRLLGATSGGGGMRAAREVASDKVHSYAFAVADAVDNLSLDDRKMLRRTGHVPDWFIARVEELRGAR